MKNKITFDAYLKAIEDNDFNIIETKIGKIIDTERIPKNKKMIKITVRFDEYDESDIRTVISNIGNRFEDISILLNRKFPFVTNLEPATICGQLSEAMIEITDEEINQINQIILN